MSPPPAKRPLRKIDAIRATLPPDYILLGVKALSNLASFATLACTECGGPWVHKSEQNTPTRSEITFMCHQNHTAKWCSDNNEKLAMADGEEGEGETAMENAAEQETDGEISGALRMNVID